jgi:tetratricopeptide (TPR) repeat protein
MRLYPVKNYMKPLYLLTFFLFPLIVSGQQIITAANEPLVIYGQIHNALASDNPKQAIEEFKNVVAFIESQGRENELPERYFGMALALALNGNYKESITYHKKAIRLHKKYRNDEPLEIYMNLGLTYTLAGKPRKARKILGPANAGS